MDGMKVFVIEVISNGKIIHRRYIDCENREVAEQIAEDERAWLDGAYWEVSEFNF